VFAAISASMNDKGFNHSHADAFAAWYFNRNASLSGVIEDETPSRKDRTELATTGSVFDGTNYFEKTDIANSVLGANDTSFTARVRFSGNGSSGDGDYIFASYDGTPDEGFRFSVTSGFLTFSIKDRAFAGLSAVSTVTTADIQAGGIYEVVGVYDAVAETISIYVNAVFHDDNVATTYAAPTQNIVRIANRSDATTGAWFGNIYEAQIWNDQALTAAEIVKLWDKEISYFQGDKAPSVAWLLDGPTCTDLIADNDLSPVADPAAYVGSEGSTWLNDQGWNATVYESDFSEGFDGWTVTSPSIRDVLDFEGQTNVIRYTGGDEGAGTASSERLQNNAKWGKIVDGETYTLKFDIYIPSSNTNLDSIKFSSSILGAGATYIPTPDTWETFTLEGQIATVSNNYIRFYAADNGSVNSITAGDVFYLANIEVIAEESIFPKRWNADLNSNGFAGDANSFGPVKRNREYRNGPSIDLDGVDQHISLETTSLLGSDSFTLIFGLSPDTSPIGSDDRIFGNTTSPTTAGLLVTHKANRLRIITEGADQTYTDDGVMTTGAAHRITVRVNRTTNTTSFFVDGVEQALATADIDWSLIGTLDTASNYVIGAETKGETTANFDGKVWDFRYYNSALSDAEILADATTGTSETTPTRHYPISEEVGTEIQCVITGEIAETQNDPTWDFTVNDSFFHGETVGYSAVPIFVEPVELVSSTNVNFDGVKNCTIELDFFYSVSGTQEFFCVSSVAPIRIRTSGSTIQVFVRDSANVAASTGLLVLTVGELYRLKIVITEHATDPENLSSIVITDRLTGEVLASATDVNVAMSSASSNVGNPQIGIYANATNPFLGDMYRVRMWTDDTLQVSVDFPSFANAGAASDFTESGGTLEIKKIPAVSKSLDANGYPTNRPAGPYHNRTAAEVTETPIANSDSVNPIYYSSENDGLGSISLDSTITLSGPFEIYYEVYSDNFDQLGMILGHETTDQKIGFTNTASGFVFFRLINAGSSDQTIEKPSADAWHTFKLMRDSADICSVIIDGTTYPLFGGAAQTGNLVLNRVYRVSDGQRFDGRLKNLKIIDDGTTVLDMPLYKDSLDRSPSCNHGIIAEAGVSFLSNAMETDLNPDIAESETRSVTSGDRKIISIGAR